MSQITQYLFRAFTCFSRCQVADRSYRDATSPTNLNNVGTCARRLNA
jgi:hypothetical protein